MFDVQILQGDSATVLRTLPDACVRACVTSPPYYGLRDYGDEGQTGQESTVEEYLDRLTDVFAEVLRLLTPDGSCWVVIGDSYAVTHTGRQGRSKSCERPVREVTHVRRTRQIPEGLKAKDLIGVPYLLAFRLRDLGYYWRDSIVWHKPNVLPNSQRDRCTSCYETVLHLTKSPRYYFDGDAIKEPAVQAGRKRADRFGGNKHTAATTKHSDGSTFTGSDTRTCRNIWTIHTQPSGIAHYATFPEELVERCVAAGSAPGDLVLDPYCGSGTTLRVARLHGRRALGVELNPEYIRLAWERLEVVCGK